MTAGTGEAERPPLVKVVLTAFNRVRLAERAIQSVLAQTHTPIHLVIVDDASTDGTAELARSYAAECPDQISALVKSENRGVADTVLMGLRAPPDADFVAIINDDDLWEPTKLERQLAVLAQRPAAGLVFCEAAVVDDEQRPTEELFSDLYGRLPGGDPFAELLLGNCACASTLLVRREIARLAAERMPSRSLVWDYHIVLVAAGHSSVAFIEEPLAFWRKSQEGEHFGNDDRMWRDTTRTARELLAGDPALVERLGGVAAARRRVALLDLRVAVIQLRARAWREFIWHAGRLLRQRSPRPIVWLVIHSVRELARPRPRRGSRDRRPAHP